MEKKGRPGNSPGEEKAKVEEGEGKRKERGWKQREMQEK